MATGQGDCADFDMLKRQLFETTLACQRCITAIDDGVLQKSVSSNDRSSYDALLIRQLQLQVADLEQQLIEARQQSTQTLSESQHSRVDALVVQYKQKIQDIEDEKIQVVAENRKLRMEVYELQKKFQGAEELLTALTGPCTQASVDQERIQMLEAQIQIFREDFESERQDRKAEQAKTVEMEQKLSYLTRQLQMAQRSVSFSPQQLRSTTTTDYHRENCAGGRTPTAIHTWPNTIRADAAEDKCDTKEYDPDENAAPDAAAAEDDCNSCRRM